MGVSSSSKHFRISSKQRHTMSSLRRGCTVRSRSRFPIRMGQMTMPESLGEDLRGHSVLIVEDDYSMAKVLQRTLEQAGPKVIGPVPSVAEALRLIAEDTSQADILDINLGGEKVFPVACDLRQRRIPFIFCTGYD